MFGRYTTGPCAGVSLPYGICLVKIHRSLLKTDQFQVESFSMDTVSVPDSTNNLEWLLEGGEQNLALVIELLTLDCASLLLDLGWQLGFPSKSSERLVIYTIAESSLNIHTYRAPLSARSWILSQYLKIVSNTDLRTTKSKDDNIRTTSYSPQSLAVQTAGLLNRAYSWPLAEAAQACGVEPERLAKSAFQDSRNSVSDQSNKPVCPAISEAQLHFIAAEAEKRAVWEQRRRKMADWLKEGFVITATILFASIIFWIAFRLTPEDKPPVDEAALLQKSPVMPAPTATPPGFKNIAYIIHNGDTLEKIASLTGTPLGELLRLNSISMMYAPRPGESLWVSVADVPPTDVPSSFTPNLAQLHPLTGASALDEIRQRMREGKRYWRTLQADYQLKTFIQKTGAQNEQQVFRFQVWISQPYYSNEVFGRLNDTQNLRHIIRYGRNYNMYIGFAGAYLDPNWKEPLNVLLYSPVLREMIFPGDADFILRDFSEAVVSGEESVADRASLILEWGSSKGRIVQRDWIDTLSGIVLRRQVIDPEREFMISDMAAMSIEFDIPLSGDIFDPSIP